MCTACPPSVQETEANPFADRLVAALNNGALTLMLSIGHRTGLFDRLSELNWVSSKEIASTCELKERYVREWLGAMVVGQIMEYDPEKEVYRLPSEHAAFLTRSSAPHNLAALTQFISVLGSVEDDIVTCFKDGGGVPYSRYTRFHEVMADDSGQTVLPALLDDILPLVPGLTQRLEAGIDVLDLACGQGRALVIMAEAFPASRFTGIDFSEEAIATGRELAVAGGLSNLQFSVQDAASWSEENAYDLITTFDAIHDQAKPLTVLKNIRRALRPNGVYLMQDIDAHSRVEDNLEHPIGTLLYTISCMHCMTVSLAQDGAGLGTMWGVELARQMLQEAGFNSIRVERLKHDVQNCYYIMEA